MVIFMEYKIGNSRRVKSRGNTYLLNCPHCSKLVEFGVFSNYKRELVPWLPLIDCNTVYFLICPNCASVFTVDENVGDDFKSGNREDISEKDLKELKEFK